jgi:hypothetical protein
VPPAFVRPIRAELSVSVGAIVREDARYDDEALFVVEFHQDAPGTNAKSPLGSATCKRVELPARWVNRKTIKRGFDRLTLSVRQCIQFTLSSPG